MRPPLPIAFVSIVLALALSGIAFAQDLNYPTVLNAKPMFVTGTPHPELAPAQPSANLTQWYGTYKDLTGKSIHYTMVGPKPAKNNSTTNVPVYIVPVVLVYGANNGNRTFDPANNTLSNGRTIIQNILLSPLFDLGMNFTVGGVNLGTTQYIDAYQRGNFWKFVKKAEHSQYHVLLQPTVFPAQTINVGIGQGQVVNNPFGSGVVGLYDINAFDQKLQSYMKQITQVNPGVLPLFITYDVYLTSGGCCIGGYHSSNGGPPIGQTYATATYVDSPGAFSQDVSAISHELGEWMDDPFVNNHVNCQDNSIMENGDPLEGNANFGGYPYTLNGFTYNLQSLVFIPYFGAPRATSVNKWLSFQNEQHAVCPGQ